MLASEPAKFANMSLGSYWKMLLSFVCNNLDFKLFKHFLTYPTMFGHIFEDIKEGDWAGVVHQLGGETNESHTSLSRHVAGFLVTNRRPGGKKCSTERRVLVGLVGTSTIGATTIADGKAPTLVDTE